MSKLAIFKIQSLIYKIFKEKFKTTQSEIISSDTSFLTPKETQSTQPTMFSPKNGNYINGQNPEPYVAQIVPVNESNILCEANYQTIFIDPNYKYPECISSSSSSSSSLSSSSNSSSISSSSSSSF